MSLATKNVEPIAGYTLIEQLGAGGYGEVWKAAVPGGLFKAVKLVYGQLTGDRAANELKALNRIKSLRHPFLLSLERIEVVEGQLVIVTELADCSLKDRYELRKSEGLPGIPRRELLQYMRDAADALDYINEHHSLQHLDIKPENLLLIGEHLKVADFGLVKDIHDHAISVMGGLTPLYAAPELFHSVPSSRSDQYSLAILYQEMLTGSLPFPGKSTAQLANQHMNAPPLMQALPPGDRKVIARALAKEPQQRFASCKEMIDFLQNEVLQNALPPAESWFPEVVKFNTKPAEFVNATIKLSNTGKLSNTEAVSAYTAEGAKQVCSAAPVTQHTETASSSTKASVAAEPKVRNTFDMFEDLEETTKRCNTDFVDTRLLNGQDQPQITYADAMLPLGEVSLRPTLIVGVGRVAGIVLQKIKQQLVDRWGSGTCPAVEFLLLDTDSQDIQRACRGDDGAALAATEVLHMPLRKSQDYRNDGQALLSWISRRWLFNIPRSQKTEGLRPLGRLALVDHARTVHGRFKKALQRIAAPENIAQASSTGQAFAGSPRVLVLGASCGGTAGGMLLDVGLIARQMLERLGYEDREVTGLLLHYRGRNTSTHELAMVNSFAVLSELSHYAHTEHEYPGDASCGLEPRAESLAPFTQTYLIHLGDFLSEELLGTSVEPVAEYLYTDMFTPATGFLRACRAETPDAGAAGVLLRGMGLHGIGAMSSDAIPWATIHLCSDLLARWLGEKQPEIDSVHEAAENVMRGQFESRGLAFEPLLKQFQAALTQRLPQAVETICKQLLRPAEQPLTAAVLAQFDCGALLTKLNQLLGKPDSNSLGELSAWPALLNELAGDAAKVADSEANALSQALLQLMEQPGLRTCGAQRAHKTVVKQLAALNEAAREQRLHLVEQFVRLERMLGIEDTPATARNNPLRKTPQEYETQFGNYVQARLLNVALYFVQVFTRRLGSAFVKIGDQLLDLRRDLQGISTQMSTSGLPATSGNSVDCALRELLQTRFQASRSTLVGELDSWLQSQFFPQQAGFLATVEKGGEHRLRFVSELFQTARRMVMHSVQDIDFAEFLLQTGSAANEPAASRLIACLQLACPEAVASAECRTLLLVSATGVTAEQTSAITTLAQQYTQATPAVVTRRESGFTTLCELNGISIREAAQRLIEHRTDIADYSERIFSRNDIPFQPLDLESMPHQS